MRIVIVTPPIFSLAAPASAPSVLTAMLRAEGHEAINFDASRFCVEHLLTKASLTRSRARLPMDAVSPVIDGYLLGLEDSVAAMRGEVPFQDITLYQRHRYAIEQALALHAKAHGRSQWNSSEFSGNHNRLDPFDLLRAVRNGGELLDEPIDASIPHLIAFRPSIVALSVSFPQQLYGTLRLAHSLRDAGFVGHICLGGATVTRLRGEIALFPDLFDLVDSVILREGEGRLGRLADAIALGTDPVESVPGLMARRSGRIVLSNVPPYRHELTHVPPPDFDDLVPGSYLSPRLVVPLSTTRNCYFDKCTFCAISRSFDHGFRQMPAERMAHQMWALAHKHLGALFKDVSEALPPKVLLPFADLLASEGQAPPWEAYLRFERAFAPSNVAVRLRNGGLRVVYFGLESGSEKLLDKMNKQVDLRVAEHTIRTFADAGIWVHLFLMCGFFGETEADHEMTLDFLRRNRGYVHSIQVAPYGLELDSDAVNEAARYGVRLKERRKPSFDLSLDFEVGDGSPTRETTLRRVRDVHRVAEECGGVLAASKYVWDTHKIHFAVYQDGPAIPGVISRHPVPAVREHSNGSLASHPRRNLVVLNGTEDIAAGPPRPPPVPTF